MIKVDALRYAYPFTWALLFISLLSLFHSPPCILYAVGVGFSYSTDPTTDYELGDRQAAKDNYAFILAFFEKFPQYLPNDFVISSEVS